MDRQRRRCGAGLRDPPAGRRRRRLRAGRRPAGAGTRAPTTYPNWADTNLTPGTYYQYEIEAVNTSGSNGYAGTSGTTITAAPTGLAATAGNGAVNLSWTAPSAYGALSYNVYRSTTPGGEGGAALATGVTATTYADGSVTDGTTYYYEVTAVNANSQRVPALPAESAASAEVSATPAGSRPSQPTGLTAQALSSSSIQLGWQDPSTAVRQRRGV